MKKAVASALEAFNRRMVDALGGRTATDQAIRMVGPENVKPDRPDTTAILPDEDDFGNPGKEKVVSPA